jgi:two-component system, OmpR family, sensor histidine kinase CpxA
VNGLPRSLFLKIFLWFGAAVLTFIGLTFLAGWFANMHRSEGTMRRPLDPLLSLYAKDAAEEFERGSQPALLAYVDNVERESHFRVFLFDKQLQELTGRRIPSGAPEVARRVFASKLPEFSEESHSPLLGRPAHTNSGQDYVLVAELPPPPTRLLFHPILHLFALVLTGALFCYWLARYLTSPVSKIRIATREFASGNLNARVAPTLGGRRDELASLAADFDEMAEKIQSLLTSQRRLLGDISHELRSPLARLNVALELARQRAGVDAASALQRIQREAETLNEMIGQLLALTRMESGAEEIQTTSFDLAQLVREVVKDADFEARARNRSVRLSAVETVVIEGIPNLLRPAIENVVRNAVHHTAQETEVEITLAVDSPSGATDSRAGQGNVVIVVRDHGPGVPEEALSKIFRPFYRVDEARDREAGGVGLGLAIAERAVRLHGGRVVASNCEDGGLRVSIMLPLRTASS